MAAYQVERAAPAAPPGIVRNRRRSYSRADVIARIQEWAALYGAPPTVADWEPSRARRAGHEWQAARFEAGRWPSVSVVRREFGTLGAAVTAAGLPRRRAPRIRRKLRSSDEILHAIREWTARYGEPPTMADWEPSRAQAAGDAWRIKRYRGGDWPSARSVRNHFGSLTAAVRAAGLVPRPQGQRQSGTGGWQRMNRDRLEAQRTASMTGFGPAALAVRTREVAAAARSRDSEALRESLIELAAVALKWSDQVAATDFGTPVHSRLAA